MKTHSGSFRHAFLSISLLAGLLMVAVSCMKDKPESFPTDIEWNPELAFPLGTESFGLNAESGFDTTLFELDTITGFPEWVSQTEVVLEGNVDFDLNRITEITEELDRILFRVNIYNEFPNKTHVQAYFMGNSSNTIDSMFSEGPVPVPAARIVGNGETTDPGKVRRDALFEKDRIAPLSDVTSILFKAIFKNPEVDTSLIDYYRNYQIEADLGAMIDLTMQF